MAGVTVETKLHVNHLNGMRWDEQDEEARAGHVVRGKCMLAVAKGRKRVRAMVRGQKARY